jgi:hypothetical protein
MAVVTYPEIADLSDGPDPGIQEALEVARERTRNLPYGEIVGAVFPIHLGGEAKAWYRVVSLRPLRLAWLPYTQFRVDPDALNGLSKTDIYRLIETDI